MEVRRLSADFLWIELPLSLQTCLVVWHAMETCGLRNGKINSYYERHFEPLYDWQEKIVEGRTSEGLFDPRAKIQAQLSQHEGGTLLRFFAANTKQDFDFGSSWRAKRRLVPRIEEVLLGISPDWHDEALKNSSSSPIASPHESKAESVHLPPSFERLVPLVDWKTSLKGHGQLVLGCLPWTVAYIAASCLRITGPLFLGLAVWEMWKWHREPYRRNFVSALYILFCVFWGGRDSWRLLQHWI